MAEWKDDLARFRADGRRAVGGVKIPAPAVEIYCDGAVLINPGGAGGWGIVAMAGSQVVHRAHGPLHNQTNNQAEYKAIIQALKWLNNGATQRPSATIYSDSQLAVNQITGNWACKAEHLELLRDNCLRLLHESDAQINVEWIPRGRNAEADMEAARGLAEALGVDEEEAVFLLAAAGHRIAFLKANEKAKKLTRTLVTNVISYDKELKRRVIHFGLQPACPPKTAKDIVLDEMRRREKK